jgi:hypothetical protein
MDTVMHSIQTSLPVNNSQEVQSPGTDISLDSADVLDSQDSLAESPRKRSRVVTESGKKFAIIVDMSTFDMVKKVYSCVTTLSIMMHRHGHTITSKLLFNLPIDADLNDPLTCQGFKVTEKSKVLKFYLINSVANETDVMDALLLLIRESTENIVVVSGNKRINQLIQRPSSEFIFITEMKGIRAVREGHTAVSINEIEKLEPLLSNNL